MNELEMQLSRLFNAAAGEPPHHVTAHAARRQALKRRVITCVTATAVLALAGSIGLAVSANATAPHKPLSRTTRVNLPKYFVETGSYRSAKNLTGQSAVRSTATGKITGLMKCPGPFPSDAVASVAAASPRVFFVACQTLIHLGTRGTRYRQTGTRIYRFQLTASGRVDGFRPIEGGKLPGFRGIGLAASPDGSELAIDVIKLTPGFPGKMAYASAVLMINPNTGARATWRVDTLRSGASFKPGQLSFYDQGRELAILGEVTCSKGKSASQCHAVQELLAVSSPARGGLLSRGREILTSDQLLRRTDYFIENTVVSPDGSTVTVGIYASKNSRILQVSATTGKTLRTLLRSTKSVRDVSLIGADSTGHFITANGVTPNNKLVGGWIDHRRLHLFKMGRINIGIIAW